MTVTVGFVGLGNMGLPMACNLAAAGFKIRGFDVVASARDALSKIEGAEAVHELRDVAVGAAVVITMLPDSPQVLAVLSGPDGLIAYSEPGTLLVDMSTISPQVAKQVAADAESHGLSMLDAPVSGGVIGAEKGTLSIMVGGADADLVKARPILEAMGGNIVHCGPTSMGQTFKLCNQICCAGNILALSEAFALCRSQGGDLSKLRDAMSGGSAGSWMLNNVGPQMISGNDKGGFTIDLQLKDLRLVLETAMASHVALPGTALAAQLYQSELAHGGSRNANYALHRVIDRLANQPVTG
jgi:2-hydroxy-3-oxopropionate reductase